MAQLTLDGQRPCKHLKGKICLLLKEGAYSYGRASWLCYMDIKELESCTHYEP